MLYKAKEFFSIFRLGCNTDIGDILISRSIIGRQKATIEIKPVTIPSHNRPTEGSGNEVDINPDKSDEITPWPPQPTAKPHSAPMKNSITNCIENTLIKTFGVAPKVLSTAT